jgi:hypothetical protein
LRFGRSYSTPPKASYKRDRTLDDEELGEEEMPPSPKRSRFFRRSLFEGNPFTVLPALLSSSPSSPSASHKRTRDISEESESRHNESGASKRPRSDPDLSRERREDSRLSYPEPDKHSEEYGEENDKEHDPFGSESDEDGPHALFKTQFFGPEFEQELETSEDDELEYVDEHSAEADHDVESLALVAYDSEGAIRRPRRRRPLGYDQERIRETASGGVETFVYAQEGEYQNQMRRHHRKLEEYARRRREEQ